jgi:hypothetical protein
MRKPDKVMLKTLLENRLWDEEPWDPGRAPKRRLLGTFPSSRVPQFPCRWHVATPSLTRRSSLATYFIMHGTHTMHDSQRGTGRPTLKCGRHLASTLLRWLVSGIHARPHCAIPSCCRGCQGRLLHAHATPPQLQWTSPGKAKG